MKNNFVYLIGSEDIYNPEIPQDEKLVSAGINRPSHPNNISNRLVQNFRKDTGLIPPSIALDLLHLGIAIYAADLTTKRDGNEESWGRDFVIHLPVWNLSKWENAQELLSEALEFLTCDKWQFVFRQNNDAVPAQQIPAFDFSPSAVSLFSGGMDSLIGAVDQLEETGNVMLVSHYGGGTIKKNQSSLFDLIQSSHAGQVSNISFWLQPKTSIEKESTKRSRSFLFLSMGMAIAAGFGEGVNLQVPENGFMSLNVPLSARRLGSLSTRTTHPFFIGLFQKLTTEIGLKNTIVVPYRFQTKGEMLLNSRNNSLLNKSINFSMSCSQAENARFSKLGSLHCGYCVPCIIRRSSMHAAGFAPSTYKVDILKKKFPPGQRSGSNLQSFKMAIENVNSLDSFNLRQLVMTSGPLPAEDFSKYADVYVRGLSEVKNLLDS